MERALDVIEAAGRTRAQGESCVSGVRRLVHESARIFLLGSSTDAAGDPPVWHNLVQIAQTCPACMAAPLARTLQGSSGAMSYFVLSRQ